MTDRLLALALRLHEDRIDPSTGQDVTLATNPALADYWDVAPPVIDYAARALAEAREQVKDEKYPESYRHMVGLTQGWEQALAAGEGASADE